ncbi:MAG: winged helix-turn-helix transcriptional regulator [Lepagella sp.]
MDTCPIRNVISRFSGKWSMLILCILSDQESLRFNQLGRAIPDISPKVLTSKLKVLEEDRLIKRQLYPEIPPRVEYSLTHKGKSLMPIIHNLIEWATDNRK